MRLHVLRRFSKREAQGQMRVIEAIMASLLIVFAVVFVDLFAAAPASPKYEAGELEKIGFNVLHDLDEEGLLGRFVCKDPPEWANLTSALAASLPTDVYFNLTAYDTAGHVVNNNVPISYGTSRVFTNSTYVASVTYVVPGYMRLYRPRVLILQLVRG